MSNTWFVKFYRHDGSSLFDGTIDFTSADRANAYGRAVVDHYDLKTWVLVSSDDVAESLADR